jgi:putative endonuclease
MAWMYILKCADGTYYTGSTKNLELRFEQHQTGLGANYTRKRLPVEVVYFEEYDRVDEAFYREKQVQGWSRVKKDALIASRQASLPNLSRNYGWHGKPKISCDSVSVTSTVEVSIKPSAQ